MGTMVPAEGNRWIITLGCFHGDTPTDVEDFEAFTRSLPSPEIADVQEPGPADTAGPERLWRSEPSSSSASGTGRATPTRDPGD